MTNRTLLAIPIAIVGLMVAFTTICTVDDMNVFYAFMLIGLHLIFLALLICLVVLDVNTYKKRKLKICFLPSAVGAFAALSIFLTHIILISRDSSPIILQAGFDGGFNGCWFEFREDGTYKFGNSGGIGATYTRGVYVVKDSVIYLDKSNIDDTKLTNKLVIREENDYCGSRKMLYQLNDKKEVVDEDFAFVLNVDKRKK